MTITITGRRNVVSTRDGNYGWKSISAAEGDLLPTGWSWAAPWELVVSPITDRDGWVGRE